MQMRRRWNTFITWFYLEKRKGYFVNHSAMNLIPLQSLIFTAILTGQKHEGGKVKEGERWGEGLWEGGGGGMGGGYERRKGGSGKWEQMGERWGGGGERERDSALRVKTKATVMQLLHICKVMQMYTYMYVWSQSKKLCG